MPSRVDNKSGTKPRTTKRMLWMIGGVLLLIAVIAGIKVLLVMRMIHSMPQPAPATVSTTRASEQSWQPALNAVGTLRAAQGADLAMDASGLVTAVPLKSGQDVKQGQLLLQLRDADEAARLEQLQATAKLSQLTFERARKQVAAQAISRADYDRAAADLKANQAAVSQQQEMTLAIVPGDRAEQVLAAMRRHPLGVGARRIGSCVAEHPRMVVARTGLGGTRVVDLPIGEQLPRIC